KDGRFRSVDTDGQPVWKQTVESTGTQTVDSLRGDRDTENQSKRTDPRAALGDAPGDDQRDESECQQPRRDAPRARASEIRFGSHVTATGAANPSATARSSRRP